MCLRVLFNLAYVYSKFRVRIGAGMGGIWTEPAMFIED